MNSEIANRIKEAGVIAVVVLDKLEHAVPLANALLEGGVDTVELTLRTSVAMDAARQIKKEVPDMCLGFGTVLTHEQLGRVNELGADFAVAPGCNPAIIAEAQKIGLPFAPGIMTPTDIEMALQLGCRTLKYFPAKTSGGLKHLESMSAPYKHLGLQFIPLGGVNMGNAREYLTSPLISAVGGSWVAKRDLILKEDWDAITKNASEIRKLINQIRAES